MSRLTHTDFQAYLRYMQASTAQFWALVEGIDDRPFYGGICEVARRRNEFRYEVASAEELPGGTTGGKTRLITFFRFLHDQNALYLESFGKQTIAGFFLDKDVDDYKDRWIHSPHVIYTEHYHLENYYFRHGELAKAAAASAALDLGTVRASIADHEDWRRNAAGRWKEWVTFCVFAHAYGVRTVCNYGVPSQINVDTYGEVDLSLQAARGQTLQLGASMTQEAFEREFNQVRRWVDELYSRGRYDCVFKGEWYAGFLARTAHAAAGGRQYQHSGLERRLVPAVAATIDFSQAWTRYFLRRIDNLLTPKQQVSLVRRAAEWIRNTFRFHF